MASWRELAKSFIIVPYRLSLFGVIVTRSDTHP